MKAKKRNEPWKPIVHYVPIPPKHKECPAPPDLYKAGKVLQEIQERLDAEPEVPDPRLSLSYQSEESKAERAAVRKKHGPVTRRDIGGLCWDDMGTGLPGTVKLSTGPMGLAWGDHPDIKTDD